jgi:putative addiction module killer protein
MDRWLGGQASRRPDRSADRKAQAGLLSDAKSLGGGAMELRVDTGPGYRVYFVMRGQILIVLPRGGDKKTQRRDIERAKALAGELEDRW